MRPGGLAGTLAVLSTCLALVVSTMACQAPAQGSATANDLRLALAAVPEPPDAQVVSGHAGIDNGDPFVEYTSSLAPGAALASYDALLKDAGYTATGTSETWHGYTHAGRVYWISVGRTGPPTSILVRVAGNTIDTAVAPDGTPVGDPLETAGPLTATPATPEPATRPGSKPLGGKDNNSGAGGGNEGNQPARTGKPTTAGSGGSKPADKPAKTAKPKPTPKPTNEGGSNGNRGGG